MYRDALDLAVRMRSGGAGQDGRPLGFSGEVETEAWFLFDHRGGRAGPAVEIVEWTVPRTAGCVPPEPSHLGIQALGFGVPVVDEYRDRMVRQGATPTGWRLDGPDGVGVDGVARDVDGAAVELVGRAQAPGPTLQHVRLNCSDVTATTRWYEGLGLVCRGPVATARWHDGDVGPGTDVIVQRLVPAVEHSFELHLTSWPPAAPAGRRRPDGANRRGLFRQALAVDDLRAATTVSAAGVPLPEPVYVPLPGTALGGLWVAFLRDPDGVTVELVERPAARGS